MQRAGRTDAAATVLSEFVARCSRLRERMGKGFQMTSSCTWKALCLGDQVGMLPRWGPESEASAKDKAESRLLVWC